MNRTILLINNGLQFIRVTKSKSLIEAYYIQEQSRISKSIGWINNVWLEIAQLCTQILKLFERITKLSMLKACL